MTPSSQPGASQPGAPDDAAGCHPVVMVGPYPSDEAVVLGGVQAVVFGLSAALRDRPDVSTVEVYSLPLRKGVARGHRALRKGQVIQLDAPLDRQMLTVRHLPAVLRRLRGRPGLVVHAHGSGLFQLALTLACRWRGIPLVWTLHGITEIETWNRFRERPSAAAWLRWGLYTVAERLQQRLAREIIVDTDYVRRFVGDRSRRTHVIPAGIRLDEAAAVAHTVRDPDLVLSLGVIHPRKGHHLLLEAFAVVHAARPATRLVIAGALADPAYAAALDRQLDTLGLRGCVALRCDLPRADILGLLGRAAVFALHSQEESQGIALCEAMAAGVAVVATRVGGIPDVVAQDRDGLLTAHGDVAGFAAALLRLLADPALRARLGEHGRQAAARFDWEAVADATMAVYRQAQCRRADARAPATYAPAASALPPAAPHAKGPHAKGPRAEGPRARSPHAGGGHAGGGHAGDRAPA